MSVRRDPELARVLVANLAALLAARGWDQTDLARAAGVGQATISRLLGGQQRDLRLSTLVALADALAVSVPGLLEVVTYPPAPLPMGEGGADEQTVLAPPSLVGKGAGGVGLLPDARAAAVAPSRAGERPRRLSPAAVREMRAIMERAMDELLRCYPFPEDDDG